PQIPVICAGLVIPSCAQVTCKVVAVFATAISVCPLLPSAKLTPIPTLVMEPEALESVMEKPEYAERSNVLQLTSALVAVSWTLPMSVKPKPAWLAPVVVFVPTIPEKVQFPLAHVAEMVLAPFP